METQITGTTTGLGGSLPVDSVQELASINLKDIPDRYIRPELELDDILVDNSLHIPVIDMIKLATDQHLDYEDEMAKLHQACKEWGFFQLINHGATEVIEKMKVVIGEFFKLPLEQRMEYAQQPNSIEGYGQAFVVSGDQKLDWADMLFLRPLPVSQRDMRFWPKSPTSFRSTFDKYSFELKMVFISLLKLMAINLGVESEKLCSMFEDGRQGMRMNYYPPCLQADKVIGLTPHSDATIMSNGAYRSIEHSAVVNFQKERLSIAAFHGPNLRTKIGPLPDLGSASNGANYKAVEHEEFLRLAFRSKLDGKSLVNYMKIDQQKNY